MSGGVGFSKLGESLQKLNRSFLKHTESFKNHKGDYTISKKRTIYKFKTPTKKGLIEIRKKVLKEGNKEKIKMAVLGGILLTIGTLLFLQLFK